MQLGAEQRLCVQRPGLNSRFLCYKCVRRRRLRRNAAVHVSFIPIFDAIDAGCRHTEPTCALHALDSRSPRHMLASPYIPSSSHRHGRYPTRRHRALRFHRAQAQCKQPRCHQHTAEQPRTRHPHHKSHMKLQSQALVRQDSRPTLQSTVVNRMTLATCQKR